MRQFVQNFAATVFRGCKESMALRDGIKMVLVRASIATCRDESAQGVSGVAVLFISNDDKQRTAGFDKSRHAGQAGW